MCQARGVQQEFQCLTRVFQSIERECFTRVCHKSVRQECLTRVSHKSVPQECPTRVPHKSAPQECHKSVTKSVPHDCPRRVSSVKRECSARVAFNAIKHLLFAVHCSVGTLLLLELVKNAFGFVASISFFLCVCVLMEYSITGSYHLMRILRRNGIQDAEAFKSKLPISHVETIHQ